MLFSSSITLIIELSTGGRDIMSAEKKKGFSSLEVLALAFGAMIGWGWVILSGVWVRDAGVLGATIAFVLGGAMVLCIGMIYGELTSMMPSDGGVVNFVSSAFGKKASAVVAWTIILAYASVVGFEAVAFADVFNFMVDGRLSFAPLYQVQGNNIYLGWLLVALAASAVMTFINLKGADWAVKVQSIVTGIILISGLVLLIGNVPAGLDVKALSNVQGGVKGVFGVLMMTPFMFMGFDVIPQTASTMGIKPKKLGKLIGLSVVLATLWYVGVLGSVGNILGIGGVPDDLAAVVAMGQAWNSPQVGFLMIIAGLGGIITSWNAFLIGGSFAIVTMAERNMIPSWLGIKVKGIPVNALIVLGVISSIAPFFGKGILGSLINAGSFAMILVYVMSILSFIKLRLTQPKANRPYSIKHWKLIGGIALCMTVGLVIACLPGMPAALTEVELNMVVIWYLMGGILAAVRWYEVSWKNSKKSIFNMRKIRAIGK